MIPWRLRFNGIRDYGQTKMDLSEERDHIFISGPNGSGKSTITFCLGAVLYSSKVDLEGLRSQNLSPDETWRASIDLLFKNAGHVKVDAPAFVQFSLHIEQKPGETVKKDFYIQEGENIDQWEYTRKYSSGDQNYNFSGYKKQISQKYAVDPDEFYLIWYQKEVNQFAVMHPEERFRIFSEMYGIDTIQKNWEESKELVNEAATSMQAAEQTLQNKKWGLTQKQRELDRFHDRNRRLEAGLTEYVSALLVLQKYYSQEISGLKEQIEQYQMERDEDEEALLGLREKLQTVKQNVEAVTIELEKTNQSLEEVQFRKDNLQAKQKACQKKKQDLEKQIEHVTRQVQNIPKTEEKVKNELNQFRSALDSDQKEKNSLDEQLQTIKSQLRENQGEMMRLEFQIQQDKVDEIKNREVLEEYKSSHLVTDRIAENERSLEHNKDNHRMWSEERKKLESEHEDVKNNRYVSQRQQKSLVYFASKGIKAYPLQELIELDDKSRPADEQWFDPIKYTVFVDGKVFVPPNDLYHVSLSDIVPEYYLTSLPDLHAQIKQALQEELIPFAVKALWWVKSFQTEQMPTNENGILVDTKGKRGAQEEKEFILSEMAIQKRKQDIELVIVERTQQIQLVTREMERLRNENTSLHSALDKVKKAEAFFSVTNEREWNEKKHNKLEQLDQELLLQEQKFLERLHILQEQIAVYRVSISQLEKYEAVYQEFAKEKQKMEEIQRLTFELESLVVKLQEEMALLEKLETQYETQEKEQSDQKRRQKRIEQYIDDKERNSKETERLIERKRDEYNTNEEGYVNISRELKYLKDVTSLRFSDTKNSLTELPNWTKAQAKQQRETGKITFEQAARETDIDEAAPENYEIMKQEYERSDQELQESKRLLEEYTERMERLKDGMETTINMRVLEVNQRFVNYMGEFGFGGKIDWEMKPDRRNQVHYYLYLRARKEGHRGKMEDVSTKARGGKVGKGVSGGEESLSSLLFALALLQTIQASPGYIVLDEFDSALDEGRKEKIFNLYEKELKRKLIVLSPKSHEEKYLYRFSKAYVVCHDPSKLKSWIVKVKQV